MRLLGLDFGSTTSSMMLAEVEIGRHSLTGRMGFGEPRILLQTDAVFTPFQDQLLDADAVATLMDQWLQLAGWDQSEQISKATPAVAGAALITGLAARADNAQMLARLIGERIGDSLIARADDPKLESWLAFMGSCATLSRAWPQRPLLNLDIGGGTTNPALGLNGQVSDCGCYFIGARHFRFEPGSYRLLGWSDIGAGLLKQLGIAAAIGDLLTADQVQQLVAVWVAGLEAIVTGDSQFFQQSDWHQQLLQQPFLTDETGGNQPPLVTFSGGVGELIYQYRQSGEWPATTAFGDLGIALAQAIVRSPVLSASLQHAPEHAGRATVMGLTLHSCDVSGSSLYLSDPDLLPLRDLPIVARLDFDATESYWHKALVLAASCRAGACVAIEQSTTASHASLKQLASHIRAALQSSEFSADQPLVLLLDSNLGKTLGQYITDWGCEPRRLFVVDEIPLRDARFVQIGRPHQHIVPVSFFGMNQEIRS
ncbi:ethanolamine ammonia-lyase reactivating factor EutA [Oceanobacter mangrovi]|uniref:ethanolamine ammonia-lyase reactivating factor EutA n=1 Tax=Oceanobacter mangrovi TaxID=2862510 RepID=UPI001C8F1AAC|nr:ethanolamine ammonia-lyase reactivating factor EutA [Oceanobacter mangrovi]